MDFFYGLVDNQNQIHKPVYYIASSKRALVILRESLLYGPFVEPSDVEGPKKTTQEDLESFREEQGPADTDIQVVICKTVIDEHDRIELPSDLQSSDPETAVKHLKRANSIDYKFPELSNGTGLE